MKLLVEIKDNNSSFIIDLLNSFRNVKTTQLSESEFETLSVEQKKYIDEGIEALQQGKKQSHEQVMKETKKRYPDLFQK
jgi:hypothetical protein